LAEHRRPTIADRENEYQQKQRMVQGAISSERVDYFADGKYTNKFFYIFIFFPMHKKILKLALLKIITP
jgi:hypothetical protein